MRATFDGCPYFFKFTKLLRYSARNNFRDLRGAASRSVILRANNYIITSLHSAEAKVFANRVALRKSAVFLAPSII
ncbi:MAG TPA: hypothetical protein DD415_03785 [Clostridiales bacterium]|nr:hypothetical protein [Clostridiales bacterium]